MRSAGSPGPPNKGSGRIDGMAGTAGPESSPLASSNSSASASSPSASFGSQTPIPSRPAATYERTSSAKPAFRVVICETERRGSTWAIFSRRLTSDQGLWERPGEMPPIGQAEPHGRMRHRTMAEYALEQLREAIILGELPAG